MDLRDHLYPKYALNELNELRKREELTDVVLEVEGRSFPCHRTVLASCSPYFRTMFTSGYAEAKQERVSIQDVSEVAMATILDYTYTGRLETEPDQVQAVMSAARLLQVDFVYRKAAQYMKDHLDVSNCIDVLMYADMLGDIPLQKASVKYITFRFKWVVLQPSFLQLSLPLLQSLLDKDDLLANSENYIVQAALRWIEFDKQERLQHLPAICRSFRHSFISSKHIKELESKCPSTDCKLVYSDRTTQRLGQTGTEMLIFLKEGYSYNPCYDPSKTMLYEMNTPVRLNNFSMAVTSDNELYLAGGNYNLKNDKQKLFYQYNHLLKTWEPRCEMISPRVRCGLAYLKGYIYAIGGDTTNKTAERYDPSCDEWTSMPPVPHPMHLEHCVVTLDDSIYVISMEGCYCFSTSENKWNKIDMLNPPQRPKAIVYQGCIYCMNSGGKTSVKMYNPASGVWEHSGKGMRMPFPCDAATFMQYEGSLYLLAAGKLRTKYVVYVYQYQSETDMWLQVGNGDRMFPPITKWLRFARSLHCLMARMIPKCLEKSYAPKYMDVPSSDDGESEEEEVSDDATSSNETWGHIPYNSDEEENFSD